MSGENINKAALRNVLHLHRHRQFLSRQGVPTDDPEFTKLGKLMERFTTALAGLWQEVAGVRALELLSLDPSLPCHTSGDAAGYLIIRIPKGDFHVPFHLVPGLPDLGVLAEIADIAGRISLGGADSLICISGSSLLLGDIDYVGDMDYCEYLPKPMEEAKLKEAFRSLISHSSGCSFVVCLRLREAVKADFRISASRIQMDR